VWDHVERGQLLAAVTRKLGPSLLAALLLLSAVIWSLLRLLG